MQARDRTQIATYVVAALAVLAIGVFVFGRGGSSEPVSVAIDGPGSSEIESGADEQVLVIHIAGAVRRPGLYELPSGSRIGDAVRRARGLRPAADQTAINFAAPIEDGQQVIVPKGGGVQANGGLGQPGGSTPAADASSEASAAPGTADPAAAIPTLDLATATAAEIDAAAEGFGPTLAARIVEFRDQSGGTVTSVDQLSEVPGIGAARLEALRAAFTP